MMRKIFLLFSMVLVLNSFGQNNKNYPFENISLSTESRVEDLISKLTIEEKVALMMNESPAVDRLGIPAYDWWNEALHGVARAGRATVFPQAIALAATFDDKAVYETFDIISDEARAKYHNYQNNKEYQRYKGLTFWTPNINIFRDPRWGRGMETYGEDPYLTGRMGVAVVKGLQGDDPKYFKTLACAKHYAVHSGPEWSRHDINVSVSTRDLLETYLPSFENLVKEAKVQQVMCAYNRIDGEPCCSSKKFLNVILRKEWGYRGITVSDCDAISDFWIKDPVVKRHETHADATEASVDAVRSGTDLECGRNYESLVQAIKSGAISENEINVSLRRLLTGRFKLGMFDPDDKVKWSKIPYSVIDCDKHKLKALEMARKSIVLLKNKNKLLPLSKSIRKIAVVGPNANDSIMLLGNYNGFPSFTVTILEGIRQKVPGAEIIYEKGCDLTKGDVVEEMNHCISYNGKKGFFAKFFNNREMNGKPVREEYVDRIHYSNGGGTSFAPDVKLTDFSSIIEGEYTAPETSETTFSMTADDGYRLYINDQLAFEDWGLHAATTKSIVKRVTKGEKLKLRLEYFNAESGGQLDFIVGNQKKIDFTAIADKVKDADVIIYVGGISPLLEGEEMPVDAPGFKKGDRTNIELPDVQHELLKVLKKTGKPVVFVLCTGSAIALNWENKNLDAIVNGWYGGQAAGTAIADVIFGDYNPAGRLPVTFYRSVNQLGDFEDYSMKDRTYRYMTSKPLYPFGFGLSYSKFRYSDVSLSNSVINMNESVRLNVSLINKSPYDGDEVVQVYIKRVEDKNGPVKTLRAFKRVPVKALSKSKFVIELENKAFMTYDESSQSMKVLPGKYKVMVGSSSAKKDLTIVSLIIK